MNPLKAQALVLRVIEFSETSSVVTLFTREFGKVRGLAKGARRPKSPFDAALDLLCTCRIVFLRKSSEGLDLLTEAKLERRFRGRGVQLSALYAGYYVAELLSDLTDDYDPHPELFDFADRTLLDLSNTGSVAVLILRFEVATLRLLGHFPSLSQCVECGRQVARTNSVFFSQLSGGVLCPDCRPGKPNVVSVPARVIDALEQLGTDAVWDDPLPELPRAVIGPLRGLVGQTVCHLLGRKPRMHAYSGMFLD
jgi:DNA repair protein RecO (recombination protein O)